MKRVFMLLGAVWLCGCDEPLQAVELISDLRVLGARVEVAGEPTRAAPAPGESASVAFLVASPELAPDLGFALAVCPAAPGGVGRAACAAEPFAFVTSPNGALPAPVLSFAVPAELEAAGRLAVLGVVCEASSPDRDGSACDREDAATQVSLEFELARAADRNTNPQLEPDALSLDAETWLAAPSPDGECEGLGLVEVPAGSQHAITVQLAERDRDPLVQAEAGDPERESLQLSQFCSAGELSSAFGSIASTDSVLTRSVSWTAPTTLETSQLVRFWFVVRDFRGGSDFSERAVCVLP